MGTSNIHLISVRINNDTNNKIEEILESITVTKPDFLRDLISRGLYLYQKEENQGSSVNFERQIEHSYYAWQARINNNDLNIILSQYDNLETKISNYFESEIVPIKKELEALNRQIKNNQLNTEEKAVLKTTENIMKKTVDTRSKLKKWLQD